MTKLQVNSQLKVLLRKLWNNVQDCILSYDMNYKLYLKYKYKVDKPRGYPKATKRNAVLRTRQEWEDAMIQVETLGLPKHGDLPKNWDSIVALDCILRKTDSEAHILDAGAELYSVILPWLYMYGYRHLTGINLVFDQPIKRGKIHYEYGDITCTRFEDNSLHAIICLSVIEHGVNLHSYFREASRILKPNGVLITSTDYYSDPIDTSNKMAYGVPIHIFSQDEVLYALKIAKEYNLELTDSINLGSQEKPVKWEQFNLEYTFVVFTLQKVIPTHAQ